MNQQTVQKKRDALRVAEDELTKASHLHSAVHEFSQRRSRGAAAEAEEVTRAFETFLRPGPGEQPGERRDDLGYLTAPVFEGDDGEQIDFFGAASEYEQPSDDGDSESPTLSTLLNDLSGFLAAETPWRDAVATFDALAVSGARNTASRLAAVTRLVVEAARHRRDALADDLNNDYPDESDAGETIEERGVVQEYVDSVEDPVAELSDEQPLALLPVRLETRFVGPERDAVDDDHELWVRVYPDQIHTDPHEEHLTDIEVRWGRNFWGYLWFATHGTINGGAIDREYLQDHLPDADLVEMLLDVDPTAFPDDPAERKDAIKERAWNQLLERFGRERAAYVVHELRPTHWTVLSDTDKVVQADGDEIKDLLPETGGDLDVPVVDRKAETWTRPPVARLLPDRWIAYGIWEQSGGDYRETFVLRSNAIREPLPVGPTPEAMALAEQYGSDAPGAADDGAEESDAAIDRSANIAWLADFGEAERAGMAFRIRTDDVFDGSPPAAVDDITDGVFRTLVVTGVKASMPPERTATELEQLFDAHHYTEGLELVEKGTPTNNYDQGSGYSSADDPRESMAVECSATPATEHGSNTDGDILARALGIDPVTTGSNEHVFAHVENADADSQMRAWHMNSALWPGTLGYYLQNMLGDASLPKFREENVEYNDGWFEWSGIAPPEDIRELGGLHESYRRHFVNYVRAQGPLPAFRTGTQPYGVLPAMPMSEDRRNPLDPELDTSIGDPNRPHSSDDDSGETDDESSRDGGENSDIDPTAWGDDTVRGLDSERGLSGEELWISTPLEEFRESYSVFEAHGSISDEQLAETYPPTEAAKVFTKQEIATHYDPAEAATVLSEEDLGIHYNDSQSADVLDDSSGDDPGEGL